MKFLDGKKTILGALLVAVAMALGQFHPGLPDATAGSAQALLLPFGIALLGVGGAGKADKIKTVVADLVKTVADARQLLASINATTQVTAKLAAKAAAPLEVATVQGLAPLQIAPARLSHTEARLCTACENTCEKCSTPINGAFDLNASRMSGEMDAAKASFGFDVPSLLVSLLPAFITDTAVVSLLKSAPKGYVQSVKGIAHGVKVPLIGRKVTLGLTLTLEDQPKSTPAPGSPAAAGDGAGSA